MRRGRLAAGVLFLGAAAEVLTGCARDDYTVDDPSLEVVFIGVRNEQTLAQLTIKGEGGQIDRLETVTCRLGVLSVKGDSISGLPDGEASDRFCDGAEVQIIALTEAIGIPTEDVNFSLRDPVPNQT